MVYGGSVLKEIDITKIIKLLLSHIFPILLAGVILAGGVFAYNTFWSKPVYRTSTSVLINNGGLADDLQTPNGTISSAIMSASLSLVPTCIDMMESDNIYKELAKSLNDQYSYYGLQSRFAVVSRNEQSLVIDIYTYGSDITETKNIANTFLQIVPTYISNNLTGADVKIMATADKIVKTSPRTGFNTSVAFLVGVLICSAIYIIIEFSKNTIESEKDFKSRYDLPLLGTVPLFENNSQGGKRRGRTK